jgi:hypothetical protein
MNTPIEQPAVTAIVCDAAQVAGDKLYILGGGWTYIWPPTPGALTPMALAVHIAVPWALANRRLEIDVRLVTEDGEVVEQDELGEVRATGVIEAGRPAGAREGAAVAIPFVINHPFLRLDIGGYVWEVQIDETVRARVPIQVALPNPVTTA